MGIESNNHSALIVDTNTDLFGLLSLNLKTWVACDTRHQKDAQSALAMISKTPELSLIITIARRGEERTAEVIYNYLNDHQREIPLLVVGDSTLENSEKVLHIENALKIKPFIQSCAKLLNVTAQDMANMVIPDFFGISIKFFSKINYSCVDVYSHNQQLDEYILIAEPNKYFEQDLIKNKINEGVENLYVDKNERLKFVHNATQEFLSQIDMSKLGPNESVIAQENTHELIRYKLSNMGITEDTVNLANKHLSDISKHVKQHPTLKKLLAKMLNNKTSYLFKHVQILTFIGTHILSNIDWGNDEQIEKFAFIAFFHDILLEKDEHAQIRSKADMKKVQLNPKEVELINSHAQKAAELISKYPKAPMGVDIIIRQHHGVAHGIGFSTTFSTSISPMAIVFILSEEITGHIISSGLDFTLEQKIAELRKEYTTQRFRKVIDLFETLAI